MLVDKVRICDVCGDDIACGAHYRVACTPPEAASLLLDMDDPGLIPTWEQNPDGTVRLDICQGCTLSMGGFSIKKAD